MSEFVQMAEYYELGSRPLTEQKRAGHAPKAQGIREGLASGEIVHDGAYMSGQVPKQHPEG